MTPERPIRPERGWIWRRTSFVVSADLLFLFLSVFFSRPANARVVCFVLMLDGNYPAPRTINLYFKFRVTIRRTRSIVTTPPKNRVILLLRSQITIQERTWSFGMKHVLAVNTIRKLSVFHVVRIYICVQAYIRASCSCSGSS